MSARRHVGVETWAVLASILIGFGFHQQPNPIAHALSARTLASLRGPSGDAPPHGRWPGAVWGLRMRRHPS